MQQQHSTVTVRIADDYSVFIFFRKPTVHRRTRNFDNLRPCTEVARGKKIRAGEQQTQFFALKVRRTRQFAGTISNNFIRRM